MVLNKIEFVLTNWICSYNWNWFCSYIYFFIKLLVYYISFLTLTYKITLQIIRTAVLCNVNTKSCVTNYTGIDDNHDSKKMKSRYCVNNTILLYCTKIL